MFFLTMTAIFCYYGLPRVICSEQSDLRYFEVVNPVVYNHEYRYRRFTSSSFDQNQHFENMEVEFYGFGQLFKLSLQKDNSLHPNQIPYYVVTENGTISKLEDVEQCYYNGQIVNNSESSVVFTTCGGFSGMITNSRTKETFLLESKTKNSSNVEHILFKKDDIISEESTKCFQQHNYTDGLTGEFNLYHDNIPFQISRQKRSLANQKKYIELLAVGDQSLVNKQAGRNNAIQKILKVMKYVTEVYRTINAEIVLIGLLIFEKTPFGVSSSASNTLTNFEKYYNSEIVKKPGFGNLDPDTAQLITGVSFTKGHVGYGGIGGMCTKFSSSGVTADRDRAHVVANTVAHELGHNLAFDHISTKECSTCVMVDVVSSKSATEFSTHNRVNKWVNKFENGHFKCLLNVPTKQYKPRCGDGFKSTAEECDCGTLRECELNGGIKCCDHTTCKLKSTAKCFEGPCCSECKYMQRGKICRSPTNNNECEFGEFCQGNSSLCPVNTYAANGSPCETSKICVDGRCVSKRGFTATKSCSKPCLNGGVCNNNGNCNCRPGYACPHCEYLGPGGSHDSGQGCTDPAICDGGCISVAVKIILVLLFALPLCILIIFLIFRNRKVMKSQWSSFVTDIKLMCSRSNTNPRPQVARSTNNETLCNPHVTYKQRKAKKKVKRPAKKTKEETPKQVNVKGVAKLYSPDHKENKGLSPKNDKKENPKPGNLKLQIQSYNQMDVEAGNIEKPKAKWTSHKLGR